MVAMMRMVLMVTLRTRISIVENRGREVSEEEKGDDAQREKGWNIHGGKLCFFVLLFFPMPL